MSWKTYHLPSVGGRWRTMAGLFAGPDECEDAHAGCK